MEFNKSLTEKQGDYKNLLSRLCRPIVHYLPLHVLKRLLNIIQEPVNKKILSSHSAKMPELAKWLNSDLMQALWQPCKKKDPWGCQPVCDDFKVKRSERFFKVDFVPIIHPIQYEAMGYKNGPSFNLFLHAHYALHGKIFLSPCIWLAAPFSCIQI